MIDSRFVVGPPTQETTRRRKISESKKDPPEPPKKTFFNKFSAARFLNKQKSKKKKEIASGSGPLGDDSNRKFVVKTHKETLPVRVVLAGASVESVSQLKKFLNERLPKIQVIVIPRFRH